MNSEQFVFIVDDDSARAQFSRGGTYGGSNQRTGPRLFLRGGVSCHV